jgi:hypothetical protein
MSKTLTISPSRPTLVDYVFLMAGCSLSLYLPRLGSLGVELTTPLPSPLRYDLAALLPAVMRLPEGILLMAPVFCLSQLLRGRRDGLTAVEWLWVIAGLGVALLAGLAVWEHSGTLPELLQPYASMPRKLWYLIFVPSAAFLAAVLGVAGLVRRGPSPWTHSFGLVLLLWPAAPLAAVLSMGKFV